jgi:poly-gamma-glutamate capsule biosynthesis protein CapA/YwtB (metallophosphatase superfamily)
VRVSATGDALITRRVSSWDTSGFTRLLDVIAMGDARFTNLETLITNGTGYPAADWGGTFLTSPAGCLDDLGRMGFNLIGRANNHAADWGADGVLETSRACDAAGVAHAGAGRTLAEARMPAYLDLSGGKVALLAVATATGNATYRAGAQRPDCQGRPGVSSLRFEEFATLPPEAMAQLKALVAKTRYELDKRHHVDLGFRGADAPGTFSVGGVRFKDGQTFGDAWNAHKGDVDDILRYVRDARRQADVVLMAFHGHESTAEHDDMPPSLHREFCRACIDAGCDGVIGHGPHRLRGVEIYKDRPIFYSLGNFIFENEEAAVQPAEFYERLGLDPMVSTPADAYDRRNSRGKGGFAADRAYWESVVAVWEIVDGRAGDIRLYPVDLAFGRPRPQRGRPVLADGALAQGIVDRMAVLSKPLGARVAWDERGYGTVTRDAAT